MKKLWNLTMFLNGPEIEKLAEKVEENDEAKLQFSEKLQTCLELYKMYCAFTKCAKICTFAKRYKDAKECKVHARNLLREMKTLCGYPLRSWKSDYVLDWENSHFHAVRKNKVHILN